MSTERTMDHLTISVVIPTYYRIQDLRKCLAALDVQSCHPDEVIVVVRDKDRETWDFIQAFTPLTFPVKMVGVTVPGVVAAMNCGLEAAVGSIVAFTDDDAAPHQDWLERGLEHFQADPLVGGVGGRDWVYHGSDLEDGSEQTVGKLQWWGRVIGNHHIGRGEAREVDVLKGVNMSFRRTAIQNLRFDSRMRGSGAQVHFEIMFSLSLRRQNWKLIYDPNIGVDHFRGQRFDEDQRDQFNDLAQINAVHNETIAILEYLSPIQRPCFLLWGFLIGTRDSMGLAQWMRLFPQDASLAGKRCWASWRGRWQGYQTWKNSREINRMEYLSR